jgi:hypothetical protein
MHNGSTHARKSLCDCTPARGAARTAARLDLLVQLLSSVYQSRHLLASRRLARLQLLPCCYCCLLIRLYKYRSHLPRLDVDLNPATTLTRADKLQIYHVGARVLEKQRASCVHYSSSVLSIMVVLVLHLVSKFSTRVQY